MRSLWALALSWLRSRRVAAAAGATDAIPRAATASVRVSARRSTALLGVTVLQLRSNRIDNGWGVGLSAIRTESFVDRAGAQATKPCLRARGSGLGRSYI